MHKCWVKSCPRHLKLQFATDLVIPLIIGYLVFCTLWWDFRDIASMFLLRIQQVILIITSEIYNIVVLIHSINVLIKYVRRLDWIETGIFWSPLYSNTHEMSCEFDEKRSFLVEHHQLANLGFVLAVHLEVMGWPWGTYVLEYRLCVTYQQLV